MPVGTGAPLVAGQQVTGLVVDDGAESPSRAVVLREAGTGALLARRVGTMMVVATVVGILSTWLGLLASWWLDLAAGASIVLVATGCFFLALLATSLGAARHPVGDRAR